MASLYRKWRSRSFEDLVGQPHVVRTLRNAVRQHRVAHAYLFTGPRGTGKTSTARILAKAVNCLQPQDGNPCNACEACVAADEGRAIDVIEIDAASNTSVENVRDLRERVAYAAGEGRFKVYIVDEVHRLSGAAFDAFLKTLEEPPPHVIFVFASTEPHKVPPTIASRCQRFDFRRIPPAETLDRVRFVAGQESLSVADGALSLIALYSNGSLRDALGLLDQVASYTSDQITEADVRSALGLADPTLVARLTDALLQDRVGDGLREGNEFVAAGGDPRQLIRQLIGYWRALLLQVTGASSEMELDPGLTSHLEAHANQVNGRQVLAVLRAFVDQEFSARYDVAPSLPYEVGYVQAALVLHGTGEVRANVQTRPAPAARQAAPQPGLPQAAPARPARPVDDARAPAGGTLVDAATPDPRPSPEPDDSAGSFPAASGSPDLTQAWPTVVDRMRSKSSMLQAILRSGYLLKVGDGEVTIGFEFTFHRDQFADVKKRRLLEEVIADVVGSSYRVTCVQASRQDIESVAGVGAVQEDDGFIEEAAQRLREFHSTQLGNGSS